MIGGALRAVERFLLPNVCVVCSGAVGARDPDSLVCGPCRSRLRPVTRGCKRCWQPLPPVGPCRFCADWEAGLVEAASAVWMGDEAREIVHHLKYEGYTKLAELAASAIAQRIQAVPRGAILVPIPLGARRRFERGYNQASEIALALSKLWSLQVSESVIRRRRETPSQTALTPEERVQNVTAAFKAIHPVTAASNVAILVDDVLTTGATIASGASALLEAGWEEVRAVTFARALPFVVRMEVQS